MHIDNAFVENAQVEELAAILAADARNEIQLTPRERNMIANCVISKMRKFVESRVHSYEGISQRHPNAVMVQDCWSNIFEMIRLYDPTRGRFSTYCYYACATVLNRAYRDVQNNRVLTESDISVRQNCDANAEDGLLDGVASTKETDARRDLRLDMRDFADFLRAKYPEFRSVIDVIFGSSNELEGVDFHWADIARETGMDYHRIYKWWRDFMLPEAKARFHEFGGKH